jgi:hypothetical protein
MKKSNHQAVRAKRHGVAAHMGQKHLGSVDGAAVKDGVHGHFKKGANK